MPTRPRGATRDSVLAERKRGAKSCAEIARTLGLLPSYVNKTLSRNGVSFPIRRSEKQRAFDMTALLRRAHAAMLHSKLNPVPDEVWDSIITDIKAELDHG